MDDDARKQRDRESYEDRGIPTGWREQTPQQLRPAFRLFYRAMPSPKADAEGSVDAENFLHEPLAELRKAQIVDEEGLEIGESILQADGDEPSISTLVVNHEKTLNRYVMHAFVAVSTNPHKVGITILKEAAPEDAEY